MTVKELLEFIKQKLRGEEGEIIPVLRTVPIFEGMSYNDLKKIEIIAHERTFKPGETVFHEKQPGVGMYIIKRGQIKLVKNVNKKQVVIGELKNGEFFGEMSLLDDYPRSAGAIAAVRTEALGIYRPDLFDLIDRNPRLGAKIMTKFAQRMAGRLRETTEKKVQEIGGGGKD